MHTCWAGGRERDSWEGGGEERKTHLSTSCVINPPITYIRNLQVSQKGPKPSFWQDLTQLTFIKSLASPCHKSG